MKKVQWYGILGTLILLLVGITVGFAQAQSREELDFRIDHFKVYKVKDIQMDWVVGLRGQFDGEVKKVSLYALTHFANPVSKNGGEILNQNAHLTWYQIKQEITESKRSVVLRNQFGDQKWTIGHVTFLLVPAEKKEEGSSFPGGIDHFKCYEVLSGDPVDKEVSLKDLFDEEKVAVKQPKFFCVPVEKHTGEKIVKIKNERDHLAFYTLEPQKEYSLGNLLIDQFGRWELDVLNSVMLGVPSLKEKPPRDCIDFEDLQLKSRYMVGDIFTHSGATISGKDFQWGNGGWTSNGYAEVQNRGLAGGSGHEMLINNINLNFNFGNVLKGLSLLFGEYGGNLNIEINGKFLNFKNFVDIHGATLGSVSVSVINGFGNDTGSLRLVGAISSFAIGGQELWIDDVCPLH